MLWYKEWANSDSHPKIVAAGFWGATVFRCLCRVSAEFDLDGVVPSHYCNNEYLTHRLRLDPATECNAVQRGLSSAVASGLLIENDDLSFTIDGWGERQIAASGAKTNTERSREFRLRHQSPATKMQRPATECNDATLDKIRVDKKREDKKNPSSSPDDVSELQRLWNDKAHQNLPRCRDLTEKRKRHLRQRLKERSVTEWEQVIERMNKSAFLRGEKGSWRASFDWLFGSQDNSLKVIEGKYDDPTDPVQPVAKVVSIEELYK